jgi:hypothetical protein
MDDSLSAKFGYKATHKKPESPIDMGLLAFYFGAPVIGLAIDHLSSMFSRSRVFLDGLSGEKAAKSLMLHIPHRV